MAVATMGRLGILSTSLFLGAVGIALVVGKPEPLIALPVGKICRNETLVQ